MKIQIKKLYPDAIIPTQARKGDAGYDLYALEGVNLKKGERNKIPTGICVAIPDGYYGRIAPRSGLAYKNGIDVLGGVVDSAYRGEIGIILINLGENDTFEISRGDKIAQLIIEKCHDVEWIDVEVLPESDRGTGGFGSTGT